MREILFRGKRIDNGEWMYGYYGFDDNKPLIAINKENGINGYFVCPETIGQYTGLTDKNGKKIFEGDIVTDGELQCEVVFIERYGCFQFVIESTVYAGLYSKAVEVLGNIFDNPELMEDHNDTE